MSSKISLVLQGAPSWGWHRSAPFGTVWHHLASFGTIRHYSAPFGIVRHHSAPFGTIRHYSAPCSIVRQPAAPFCTARHICDNFATCSWEPLSMFNLHFVAGEHGLFGGHESEDIRNISIWESLT